MIEYLIGVVVGAATILAWAAIAARKEKKNPLRVFVREIIEDSYEPIAEETHRQKRLQKWRRGKR